MSYDASVVKTTAVVRISFLDKKTLWSIAVVHSEVIGLVQGIQNKQTNVNLQKC
jgi:hypothetical protein